MQFDIGRLGSGWKIRSHAAQRGAQILSRVRLAFPLSLAEAEVSGYEYMRRLQGQEMLVGADLLEYMRNKNITNYDGKNFCAEGVYPSEWKQRINGMSVRVFLPGTILITPEGSRAMLYLCWHNWENGGVGGARWGIRLLDQLFYPDYACAVL